MMTLSTPTAKQTAEFCNGNQRRKELMEFLIILHWDVRKRKQATTSRHDKVQNRKTKRKEKNRIEENVARKYKVK